MDSNSTMHRAKLIESVAHGGEIVGDLATLLQHKEHPLAYDGFEPSGRMHLAQGLMRAWSVNQLTRAGCKFVFLVADTFAQLNLKLGGDMRKIQAAGELMIETWKACGMDMENVSFLWSSRDVLTVSHQQRVLELSTAFTLDRVRRCSSIMGRDESETLMASQLLYPLMQVADVLELGVDICSLGLDQRKVNMLLHEFCEKKKLHKPVVVSHHMLSGLNGDTKMSKSVPDNAIFMDDSVQDVNRKVRKAFLEPGNLNKNPLFELVEFVLWPISPNLEVKSRVTNQTVEITSLESLRQALLEDTICLKSFKSAIANRINQVLEPVRQHFAINTRARDLLRRVRSFAPGSK